MYVSMLGLVGETLLCEATLLFKNRTWYDDHENSLEHSTVMVSTGVGTSHINKGEFRVITIKPIYLTKGSCFSRVPHTETVLALCLTKRTRCWSQLWAMGCHSSCRLRVVSWFMLLAVPFHFNLGFRCLQIFNALKVRGFGRPGKHSGYIYWVMYAITSRAVWGSQLLSNKMKWGVLFWPRAS